MSNIIEFSEQIKKKKEKTDSKQTVIQEKPEDFVFNNAPLFVDVALHNAPEINGFHVTLDFLLEYPMYGSFLERKDNRTVLTVFDFYQLLFDISPIDPIKYYFELSFYAEDNNVSITIKKRKEWDQFLLKSRERIAKCHSYFKLKSKNKALNKKINSKKRPF